MATGVALLGSTGSIGRSTLSVLDRHADEFRLVAVAANRSAGAVAEQVDRYGPDLAVVVDPSALDGVDRTSGTEWRSGASALAEAVEHPDVDVVVNAVVGAAGLEATLAALGAGKRLALANKESLVAGGPIVLDALRRGGGELVPVDSEHSAILQCLRGARTDDIERLILTASGGPFREWDADALAGARPADALQHPTWSMGAKITIDSATLANKALEVIEAHFLFGIPYEQIDVVVHPQSIIHSMVEFVDGSVLAQVGFPTMELPILYALTHPERTYDTGTRFDPVAAGRLTFEAVDHDRFPAFRLGIDAGRAGGTAPAMFNAANEEAVAGFLEKKVSFSDLSGIVETVLTAHDPDEADSMETVLEADRRARAHAQELIETRC